MERVERRRQIPVSLGRPRVLGWMGEHPFGVLSGCLIGLAALAGLLADLAAPYSPIEVDYNALLASPGAGHLLGTDELGRDILSRIIHGARVSLVVGVAAVGAGSALGMFIGLTSGYLGGRSDMVAQRFVDILMSFPALVLAMAIVAAIGASLLAIVVAIAIVQAPRVARIMRSAVLAAKENTYVEAARAIGVSDLAVLWRHIVPNCVSPLIIVATSAIGTAILTEASLSFLGLGVAPPTPSWGGMLSSAAIEYATTAPWLGIFPGAAITFTVLGFNLLGDDLRDAMDPRLRRA